MSPATAPAIAPPTRASRPDERAAFLSLVCEHERGVVAVVRRFLDDPRDIEEAVQDTFVQAWRHRDRFRGDAAVFTWLYRIATNSALMSLRRRRAVTVSVDDLSSADAARLADDPLEDHPARLTTAADVRAALAELPDDQRIVVMLRDIDGLSNAEIAAALGQPITTVKARLHRGRQALRRRLHGTERHSRPHR